MEIKLTKNEIIIDLSKFNVNEPYISIVYRKKYITKVKKGKIKSRVFKTLTPLKTTPKVDNKIYTYERFKGLNNNYRSIKKGGEMYCFVNLMHSNGLRSFCGAEIK